MAGAQQQEPIPSPNKYKGITPVKNGSQTITRWRAQISFQSRTWALGDYESEEMAARTYDRAAIVKSGLHGANLNFPRENYEEEAAELETYTMEQMLQKLKDERAAAREQLQAELTEAARMAYRHSQASRPNPRGYMFRGRGSSGPIGYARIDQPWAAELEAGGSQGGEDMHMGPMGLVADGNSIGDMDVDMQQQGGASGSGLIRPPSPSNIQGPDPKRSRVGSDHEMAEQVLELQRLSQLHDDAQFAHEFESLYARWQLLRPGFFLVKWMHDSDDKLQVILHLNQRTAQICERMPARTRAQLLTVECLARYRHPELHAQQVGRGDAHDEPAEAHTWAAAPMEGVVLQEQQLQLQPAVIAAQQQGLNGLSALVAAVEQSPSDAAVSAEAAAMLTLLAERDERVEAALAAVPAVPIADLPELGLPLEGLAEKLADAGAFDGLLASHKQAVRRATEARTSMPGGGAASGTARQPAHQLQLLTQQMSELLDVAEAEYNNMQGSRPQQQQQQVPDGSNSVVATHLNMVSQHFASERALHAIPPGAAVRMSLKQQGQQQGPAADGKENGAGSQLQELVLVLPASQAVQPRFTPMQSAAGVGAGKAGAGPSTNSLAAIAAAHVRNVKSSHSAQGGALQAQLSQGSGGGPPRYSTATAAAAAQAAAHVRNIMQQHGLAGGPGLPARTTAGDGAAAGQPQRKEQRRGPRVPPPPRFTSKKRARASRARSQTAHETMSLVVRYMSGQPISESDAQVLLVLLALPHEPLRELPTPDRIAEFVKACNASLAARPHQQDDVSSAARAGMGSNGGAGVAGRMQAAAQQLQHPGAAVGPHARDGPPAGPRTLLPVPPSQQQQQVVQGPRVSVPGGVPQQQAGHQAAGNAAGQLGAQQQQQQQAQQQAQAQAAAGQPPSAGSMTAMMLPNGQTMLVPTSLASSMVVMQGPQGQMMLQMAAPAAGQQPPPPPQLPQQATQQQGQAAQDKQPGQPQQQQQQQQAPAQPQMVLVQGPNGQLQQVQLPPGAVLAPAAQQQQAAGPPNAPAGAPTGQGQGQGMVVQQGAGGHLAHAPISPMMGGLASLPPGAVAMMQLPNGQLVPVKPGQMGPAGQLQQPQQQQQQAVPKPGAPTQVQQQQQQQGQARPMQASGPSQQQQQVQQQQLRQLQQQAAGAHGMQRPQQHQQQQQAAPRQSVGDAPAPAQAPSSASVTYEIHAGVTHSKAEVEAQIHQLLVSGRIPQGSHVILKPNNVMLVQPPAAHPVPQQAQPPQPQAQAAQLQQQQQDARASLQQQLQQHAAMQQQQAQQQLQGGHNKQWAPQGQQQQQQQRGPAGAQMPPQQQQQFGLGQGLKVVNGKLVPDTGAPGPAQQQQQQQQHGGGGGPAQQQQQQAGRAGGLPPGARVVMMQQGPGGQPVPVVVPAGMAPGPAHAGPAGGTAAAAAGGGGGGQPPAGAMPMLMGPPGAAAGAPGGMMNMFGNLPPGTVPILVNGPQGQTVMFQTMPQQGNR